MESLVELLSFYKSKTILVTGHTGFKGAWLSKILINAGANVVGFSLAPNTNPNLYELLNLENAMTSIIGDIRDYNSLLCVFQKYRPELVFHLAAQPIVRESYKNPRYTYDVNVMGTVNILECIRNSDSVKSFINVTTDKVYENNDSANQSFIETDKLNGYDPYSNSKSCSEIITESYYKCFLKEKNVGISTARAGNVIGGGDFSIDRIIPDCVRSLERKEKLIIRNPNSIRPYQYVLEPLFSYLMICKYQYFDFKYCGSYNIGPDSSDCITTEDLVKLFKKNFYNEFEYLIVENKGPHEASYLKLDNSKIKNVFDWTPKTTIFDATKLTTDWTKVYLNKGSIESVTDDQITRFINL